MTVERRLARLERERVFWRVAAALLGLGLLARAALAEPTPPDATPEPSPGPVVVGSELHTRNLVIDGPDGKPRATFAVLADGTLGLVFMDAQGGQRASLGLAADGSPALKLLGPSKGYAALAVGKDGSAVLGLKSRGNAELAALPEGTLGLTLADAAGKPRATVGVKDGDAHELLLDAGGNGGLLVSVPASAPPAFELRDRQGKSLFRRP